MAYYLVEIHFKNGAQANFLAQEFNIDVTNVGQERGQIHLDRPYQFSYRSVSGNEVPIYLTLDEVAGIVVQEREEV